MSETKTSVLLIEDNELLSELIGTSLEDSGFSVKRALGITEAREHLSAHSPDLVILDIDLPDGSGLDICRALRAAPGTFKTPVIALTGKNKLADKTYGFSAGVDQYLVKPVPMAELLLWINALLRRTAMSGGAKGPVERHGLKIDPASQTVLFKGRKTQDLTKREFDLLYALVRNSPRVISREEILQDVWRTAAVGNLVDMHLLHLRHKLPIELSSSVRSVPGRGFCYLAEERANSQERGTGTLGSAGEGNL